MAHDHAPDEAAGECGPRAPFSGSLDQTTTVALRQHSFASHVVEIVVGL